MEELQLNERIGIDRCELAGIHIKFINKYQLVEAWKDNVYKLKVDFGPDEDQIITGKLPLWIKITSKTGYPFFSFYYKNNSDVNIYARNTCRLELVANSHLAYGNVNNWTVDELKEHVKKVEEILSETFGITCNLMLSKINRIELNCNIQVDNYNDFLNILKFSSRKCKHAGKTVNERNDENTSKNDVYDITEFIRQNKSNKLKMYNKAFAIAQTKSVDLNSDIVRIEWCLNKQQSVKNHLYMNKDNRLVLLTDTDIIDCFNKLVIDPIIKGFESYPKTEKKIIYDYYQASQSDNRIWQSFCSKINKHEKDNHVDPILGLTYIYKLIDENYIKDRVRTRKRLEKQLKLFSLDHLIHMSDHVVFFIAKLKDIGNNVVNVVPVEYTIHGTHEEDDEKAVIY